MPVHNHLTPTGALVGNQGMPSHLSGLFDGGKSKGRDKETLMLTRARAQEAARQYANAQDKGWAYDEDGSSSQEYFDQAQSAMGISNVNSGNDYNQMTDWLNEQTDKLKQSKNQPAPTPEVELQKEPEPVNQESTQDSDHLAEAKYRAQQFQQDSQSGERPSETFDPTGHNPESFDNRPAGSNLVTDYDFTSGPSQSNTGTTATTTRPPASSSSTDDDDNASPYKRPFSYMNQHSS